MDCLSFNHDPCNRNNSILTRITFKLIQMTGRQAKLYEDANYRVLRHLKQNPDLTQREIAQILSLSNTGLN